MKRWGVPLYLVGTFVWVSVILFLQEVGARPQSRMRGGQMSFVFTQPDGGDAGEAADGGDAAEAADGGDAEVAADGGDAQTSPLDDHNATLACKWDFKLVHPDAGSSTNPLVATAGGSACDLAENVTPNQTGQNPTAGLAYIGVGDTRLDKMLFNNTSGGWAEAATWTGPAVVEPMLIRAVVKTPAAFGTKTLLNMNATANTEIFRLYITAGGTGRFECNYDDGAGASSLITVPALVDTLYFVDCYVGTDHKAHLCVNSTCATAATASGDTGMTPDTASLGSSSTGTQVWDGYILDMQYHNAITWDETLHDTECELIMGAACP